MSTDHVPRRPAPLIGLVAVALLIATALTGCGAGMSGTYKEIDGAGSMEFKNDGTVYVEFMGMTSQARYELDGDKVVIKTPRGSQVYTLEGDVLKGGSGLLSMSFRRR